MSVSTHYHKDSSLCLEDFDDYSSATNSSISKSLSQKNSCDEKGIKNGIDDEMLPSMDGGIDAWLFLLASSMLEALVWGK